MMPTRVMIYPARWRRSMDGSTFHKMRTGMLKPTRITPGYAYTIIQLGKEFITQIK
jgi:hypothetical protein